MLFDLRSRGRRRTVQVVYLGLAGLMALGLIGFGIGGGFGGGGLFEGLSRQTGSRGASFSSEVRSAEKRIAAHPSEAAAWAALTEADLHQASGAEYYDSNTGTYTAKGKQELQKAASAWSRYLQIEPKNPSPRIAEHMSSVFSVEALDEPAKAVEALQIVIAAKPESAALYSALAEYAYLAHNEREGDLASRKAISLAPKSKRPLLELEFEKMKKQAKGTTSTSATATSSTSAAAASSTSAAATSSTSETGASSSTASATSTSAHNSSESRSSSATK